MKNQRKLPIGTCHLFLWILITTDLFVVHVFGSQFDPCNDDSGESSALMPKYVKDRTRSFPGHGFAKKRVCAPPSCSSSPCQPQEDCSETKTGYSCRKSHDFTSPDIVLTQSLRLIGKRPSLHEGRVEILHEGVWRPVSRQHWDIYGASVVCRSLGFPAFVTVGPNMTRASAPSQMIRLDCEGDEENITGCRMMLGDSSEQSSAYVLCGQDDVCASNPCLHGGSCLSHPSDRFKPTCSCNIGFLGSRCEWMSSCKVWRDIGFNISGMYVIKMNENSQPITVDCDMETDGGGWTVIQRNTPANLFFKYAGRRHKDDSYRYGFQYSNVDLWLGLDNILQFGPFPVRLRLDMHLRDDTSTSSYEAFASYDFFLTNAKNGYRANFTSYKGTAGDGINGGIDALGSSCSQSGQPFSVPVFNGWWFSEDCVHQVQLNGCMTPVRGPIEECHDVMKGNSLWFSTKDDISFVVESEMKIREF